MIKTQIHREKTSREVHAVQVLRYNFISSKGNCEQNSSAITKSHSKSGESISPWQQCLEERTLQIYSIQLWDWMHRRPQDQEYLGTGSTPLFRKNTGYRLFFGVWVSKNNFSKYSLGSKSPLWVCVYMYIYIKFKYTPEHQWVTHSVHLNKL